MLPSLLASIKSELLEVSSRWIPGQTAMPTEFWLYITYDAGDAFYVRLPPLRIHTRARKPRRVPRAEDSPRACGCLSQDSPQREQEIKEWLAGSLVKPLEHAGITMRIALLRYENTMHKPVRTRAVPRPRARRSDMRAMPVRLTPRTRPPGVRAGPCVQLHDGVGVCGRSRLHVPRQRRHEV